MKVYESYAKLRTYKWSIIKGIVLIELLDKPPTLKVKPVASIVSWSDELQQVGELCLQEIFSLGNTDSSEKNATHANTEPASVNEKKKKSIR